MQGHDERFRLGFGDQGFRWNLLWSRVSYQQAEPSLVQVQE